MTTPVTLFPPDVRDAFCAVAAFLVADMDSGEILYASIPLEVMFGYQTRGELSTGHNVDELVPAALRSKHTQHRADFASLAKTRPVNIGVCVEGQHRDGHVFPVSVSLYGIMISGQRTVIAEVQQLRMP